MTRQIEEFDILCTGGSIEGTDTDLAIFGVPYHESENAIIDKYVNSSLDEFFRDEQLRSCGNYLLFDGRDEESVRIITSPGFCSGYIYSSDTSTRISSLLTNVLRVWERDDGRIDGRYLKMLLNSTRPFQGTPFRNIQQLRPAVSYRFRSGTTVEASSYLESRSTAPPSIEQAMRQCAISLSGNTVSVLFSGGLDSLSWYLILADELGKKNVDPVTIDWRPGTKAQGPYLARPIADKLNLDLRVISSDTDDLKRRDEVIDNMTDWMKKDFMKPDMISIFSSVEPENDVVINLVNNESLLHLQMNHIYKKQYINQTNTIEKNLRMLGFLFFNQYLHNIPYTSTYMRDRLFRLGYLAFSWPVSKILNKLHPTDYIPLSDVSLKDLDLSENTIFESVLARKPLYVRVKENPELFKSEFQNLTDLISCDDTHHLARLLYYYAHMAYSANIVEKMELSHLNTQIDAPVNWGPMVSMMFDDITFENAFRPRKSLLDIVKAETGYSFSELRPLSEEGDRSAGTDRRFMGVISKHNELLQPRNSVALQYMDAQLKEWYKDKMDDNRHKTEGGYGSTHSVYTTSNMINLELLLRNSIDHTNSK